MSGFNLDQLCARHGYDMCANVNAALQNDNSKTENLVTNSLGVLQEDGVYAFFLYLESRKSGKSGARKLKEQAVLLFRSAGIKPFDTIDDALKAIRGDNTKQEKGLVDDLDGLLLAKRLLEQALTYARYHAKALGE